MLMALVLATAALPAGAQPFNPLREKVYTPWNTDRDLVDIEIVGSTSTSPEFHRLEPERVLRFRLERAYVTALLAQEEPGFEIIGFALDVDTGLPESLLQAVSRKGPSHRDIPGVPILPQLQRFQRVLSIELHSDNSTEPLERKSRVAAQCRGRELESKLFENNSAGGEQCRVPDYPPGLRRYIAPYEGDLSLIIVCRDYPVPTIDCELQFPFRGFGATLNFYHEQLPKWRASVNNAIEFLKSKEYR
jgi:hypothetical protein